MSWLLNAAVGLVVFILSLLALSTMLPSASAPARYASFTARLIISWFVMAACAFYGVIASLVLRVFGLAGLSQWTVARAFKWTMWLGTGVKMEIVRGEKYLDPWYAGEDKDGRVLAGPKQARVLVGNHQTELDILMLGYVFPRYCSVTAKSSLKWMPILGWFMALSKTVFIDRRNRASALSAFDGAAKTMRNEKQTVFIFPEGTRSYAQTPMLLPFKKGAFHLAVQAQVPIIPVVCANYGHVLDVKRRHFQPGTIPISILKPIETKGMTSADVDGLCTQVREAMLAELHRLDSEVKIENGRLKGVASREEISQARASGVDVFQKTAVGI